MLRRLVSTHAPLAGSDRTPRGRSCPYRGFNPRSPCGERHGQIVVFHDLFKFQPTLPLRGATRMGREALRHRVAFQPTLPLRGATPERGRAEAPGQVSTHAPLAGSDSKSPTTRTAPTSFNPRSPCGERQASRPRGFGGRRVSTHAPLAGSDWRSSDAIICKEVSTHDYCGPIATAFHA